MQLGEWVRSASRQLIDAGVNDSARLDVELLLCAVLGCDRSYLFSRPETRLSEQQCERLASMLSRRLHGEPIAYILNQREFWSLPFFVDNRVLIPRPDTEVLVERALSLALPTSATVIDLGVGSGAIAIALAFEKPSWMCYAADLSEAAIKVARQNANTLLRTENLSLWQGSWLDACRSQSVDLIMANPPYIDADDPHLTEGDVRFEPHSALVSEAAGLGDIAQIVQQATNVLKPGGYLMVEHGWQQQDQVVELFLSSGAYNNIERGQDYSGQARFVVASRTC